MDKRQCPRRAAYNTPGRVNDGGSKDREGEFTYDGGAGRNRGADCQKGHCMCYISICSDVVVVVVVKIMVVVVVMMIVLVVVVVVVVVASIYSRRIVPPPERYSTIPWQRTQTMASASTYA